LLQPAPTLSEQESKTVTLEFLHPEGTLFVELGAVTSIDLIREDNKYQEFHAESMDL